MRRVLLPSHAVTGAVLTSRPTGNLAGRAIVPAAGWVEPRPTPPWSAAFEGVVEQLLVVEGQAVKAGEPVAKLIEIRFQAGAAVGEASVRLRRGIKTPSRRGV